MPTKPRTKKPAAKPQRKTRAVRETATEAIARKVADALGRRLDDLLSVKQGTPVAAWTANASAPENWAVRPASADGDQVWRASEKDGCVVASYAASNDRAVPPPRTSPVEEAVARLLGAVCSSECLTDTTADRLKDIMSPSTTTTGAMLGGTEPGGASELAARLNAIADRIFADGRRRLDILNRLEL